MTKVLFQKAKVLRHPMLKSGDDLPSQQKKNPYALCGGMGNAPYLVPVSKERLKTEDL